MIFYIILFILNKYIIYFCFNFNLLKKLVIIFIKLVIILFSYNFWFLFLILLSYAVTLRQHFMLMSFTS